MKLDESEAAIGRICRERDDARAIARQRAADVQYLLDNCLRTPHSLAIGVVAIRERQTAFDALPWKRRTTHERPADG
jgi:hypothetical protein